MTPPGAGGGLGVAPGADFGQMGKRAARMRTVYDKRRKLMVEPMRGVGPDPARGARRPSRSPSDEEAICIGRAIVVRSATRSSMVDGFNAKGLTR